MRRVSTPADPVVLIGAGASPLAAYLVGEGYRSLVAVDISAAALDQLREHLGPDADRVRYLRADVRDVVLDDPVAVWHDRATFHFLTDPADQAAYAARAAAAVRTGGHLVMAAFAPSGPTHCSGLEVARHSSESLATVFDPPFELIEHFERAHETPWHAPQVFTHALLRRR